MKRAQLLFALTVIIPILALFIFWIGFPIIYVVYLSMQNWFLYNLHKPSFVFLENYVNTLNSFEFFVAAKNTAFYTLFRVSILVLFSLLTALGLNKLGKRRITRVYLGIYYLPVMVSFVSIALVFVYIYDRQVGVINFMLRSIGLPPGDFLTSRSQALLSIVIADIWKGFGFSTIILLSAFNNIPVVYYEAAKMDGASKLQLFFHITFPLIKSVMLFIIIIGIIDSFNNFTPIYTMTGSYTLGGENNLGGPGSSTTVIPLQIYRYAFEYNRMEDAAVISTLLLIVVLIITIMFFLSIFKKEEAY